MPRQTALPTTSSSRRRRGGRVRVAVALALVLLGSGLLPGTAPGARADDPPVADTVAPRVVYAEQLLKLPSTLQMGYRRYEVISAYIDGVVYPHSLLTEAISNIEPTTRYSAVTFALNGQYDRFTALLARDDQEQAKGPAYCIFEVWADGVKVFRSDAIRSALTDVSTDRAFPKRSHPQPLDIPVKGVQSLRLVTRYANEFTQRARYVNRAMGCVWGSARLTLAPDANATVIDPVLRASLRRAAVRLLPSLPAPPAGKKGASSTGAGANSLRLAILPLRIPTNLPDSPLNHGETENGLRHFLADTLLTIHQGGASLLSPLAPADDAILAKSLPADSPLRGDLATVKSLAQKSKADLLLFGALEPTAGQWRITLRLLDVRNGQTLEQVTVPVEAMSPSAGGDTP